MNVKHLFWPGTFFSFFFQVFIYILKPKLKLDLSLVYHLKKKTICIGMCLSPMDVVLSIVFIVFTFFL